MDMERGLLKVQGQERIDYIRGSEKDNFGQLIGFAGETLEFGWIHRDDFRTWLEMTGRWPLVSDYPLSSWFSYDEDSNAKIKQKARIKELDAQMNYIYDVFLSHNSLDKPAVRKIAEQLRNDGLRVWFDEWILQPGDDIHLKIEEGLESSRTLVLVMSPNALASEWTMLERNTVLFRDPSNRERRFIPLLLADCKMPDTLRRYLYIDFRKAGIAAYQQLLNACLGKTLSSNNLADEPSSGNPLQPHQEPRLRAADLLNQLLPAQFQEVVFRYNVTPQHLPQGVAQSQQAIAVIQYAIQQEGEALTKLLETIDQVAPHLKHK